MHKVGLLAAGAPLYVILQQLGNKSNACKCFQLENLEKFYAAYEIIPFLSRRCFAP